MSSATLEDTRPRVAVIDYHAGNLLSVSGALELAGARSFVTGDPYALASANACVLPGVGSFEQSMDYLRASGLADAALEFVASGKPFLGICLGFQLLFERGYECEATRGSVAGLGLVSGEVVRLDVGDLRIPHVGWDQVQLTRSGQQSPLFEDIPQGADFYFTHSYVPNLSVSSCFAAALTSYGREFVSAVASDNVFGMQFHPEKSSDTGVVIYRNFVRMAKDSMCAGAE